MKLIIAMIRPDRLQDIQAALKEPDAYTMYVSQVGDLREFLPRKYRGALYPEPRPRIRLEVVVVNDLMVQEVIDVIVRLACVPDSDRISNGSIFVASLDEWILIPANQPTTVASTKPLAYPKREAS